MPTRSELDDVVQTRGWASEQIERLYQRGEMDDAVKLRAIQDIVHGARSPAMPTLLEACDELTELLEVRGEEVVKRLCGMAPVTVTSIGGFAARMIEAIQMTNDERVHTKENYSRTCLLNCEYVGTYNFKLDEGDKYFLWRKGYLTAKLWLDKRSKKNKEKKKKVGAAIAKELKKEATTKGLSVEKEADSKKEAKADGKKEGEAKPFSLAAAAKPAPEQVDQVAEFKAQVEKVLANDKLGDDEKLDILKKRVERLEVRKVVLC